jgi:tetratricopeptide (TPR) repeat protein
MQGGFRATCLREAGSAAGAAALTACLNGALTAGTVAAAGAALVASPLVLASAALVLLAGGVYLDSCRARKSKAAMDAEFERLRRAVEAVRRAVEAEGVAGNEEREAAAAQLAEFIDRAEAWQGGVGQLAADLAEQVAADGVATREHIDAWMESVRIYLSNISADVRETRDNTRELKSGQKQLLDAQAAQHAMLEELLRRTEPGSGPQLADPSRPKDLAGALETVADLAARGDAGAARALAGQDVGAAAAAVLGEARRVSAAKRDAVRKVEAREVELYREASALVMEAGDLDGAEEAAGRVLELVPHDAEALNRFGEVAFRRGDFVEAARRFERFAGLAADDGARATAWSNWGVALNEQSDAAGEAGDRAERDRLRCAAIEKYAEAVRIKPDQYEAWYNRGNGLSKQADAALEAGNTAERDRLLREAIEKYAEAVRIKPDDHEAWYNWGVTLGGQADAAGEAGDRAERDRLRRDAIEKFAEAVRIKPDDHDAWYNWAVVLGKQAGVAQERDNRAEACRLLREALDKFERAKNQEWVEKTRGFIVELGCGAG